MSADASTQLESAVRESGLIESGSRGVALLSGGPDSASLAAGLVGALGADAVTGLHLNYALRDDSGEDEAACHALCERLGIELEVERPQLGAGNTQEAAREARYAAAERLRAQGGDDWIATGHTRTDLAETVLYRLASSPGRRALLGLAPRHGRVVRPLLALGRDETRRLAIEAGLPFHDDPSNADPRFARARIRRDVLPVLRELNPAAERNVAATWAELAEEGDALEALAAEALGEAGAGAGNPVLQVEDLAALHPAVRRLSLRALAGAVAARDVPLGQDRAEEVWRLANTSEGGRVELGGGVDAVCEAGTIRFSAGAGAEPDPVELAVPGSCRFGRWDVRAELTAAPPQPAGPDIATLDAAALGDRVEVRAWHDGDRMRPLGLDGTKSLQDLFTDGHVPRSLRRSLPVVVAGDRIAWVAGVAVSDEFKLTPATPRAAVLTASLVG